MCIKKFLAIIPALICLCTIRAYAISDSLSDVKDFRVTDNYTSVLFGAAASDIMIYRGADEGISISDGKLSIDTENKFEISTRADITDVIKKETGDNFKFSFDIAAESVSELKLITVDSEGKERGILSYTDTAAKHIEVLLDGKYAYVMLDKKAVGMSICSGLPVFKLTGSGVTAVIANVVYEATEEQTGDVITDNINSASDGDFADVLAAAVSKLGMNAELFWKLPECDRKTVTAEVKSGVPYKDENELRTAYTAAVNKTIGVDTAKYAEYFAEAFEGGMDSLKWRRSGNPLICEGGQDVFGQGSYCYDFGAEETEKKTLVTAGAKLKASGYIERDIDVGKCIVKLYFYDNMRNNPASYSVAVNDSLKVGMYDRYGYYVLREGGKVTPSSVARTVGWHKLVFDTVNQDGLAVYIDDVRIYENSQMSVDKLFIGNADSFESYSWFSTDNITVAVPFGTETAEFQKPIMLAGETDSLKIIRYTENGTEDISGEYDISYTSSDSGVISTEENGFSARAVGEAEITARATVKTGHEDKVSSAELTAFREIKVTNKERMYISGFSVSKQRVSVNITSRGAVRGTLIAAVYNDDNTLLKLKAASAAAECDGTRTAELDFDGSVEGKRIKLFLFDSLSGMLAADRVKEIN